MKPFYIKFEHLRYGTVVSAGVLARTFIAAVVKAAKNCGLKAKYKNKTWHFYHNDFSTPSCYQLI